MTYSPEELKTMLGAMRLASSAFYRDAVRIGCHPFIEFTGLMNEYIALCEAALAKGIDFTETTAHGSGAVVLPMRSFHREYLNEKLQCIYGHSLAAITERPDPFEDISDEAVSALSDVVGALAKAGVAQKPLRPHCDEHAEFRSDCEACQVHDKDFIIR